MQAVDEAEDIVRRRWLETMKKRPELPPEPAFQLTAALVHLFCAAFNFGAFLYHARRVKKN